MPTYDFKCKAGHVTEKRTSMGVASVPCPECGQDAPRVPFYSSVVLVTETGVGSGYGLFRPVGSEIKDRNGRVRLGLFEEACEELHHAHEKHEESAGHELLNTPYYKIAKKKADAIIAKGPTAVKEALGDA